MLATFLLFASALASQVANYVLTGTAVCSSANALAKNLVVLVSNDKPLNGENVSTIFDFDLDAPVVDGTAFYSVSYNGLPYSYEAPLCEEVAKSGDPCPLAIGHHHQVSTATNTLTGKVTVRITWKDVAGAEILCGEVTTKTA